MASRATRVYPNLAKLAIEEMKHLFPQAAFLTLVLSWDTEEPLHLDANNAGLNYFYLMNRAGGCWGH